MSSLKYWIWLSTLSGVGAATVSSLLGFFGDPEKVHAANVSDYLEVDGVSSADIARLMDKDLGPSEKALADCAATGCRAITIQDEEYPDRLKSIFDPPGVLFIQGRLPSVDEEPAVAVVGTRGCSPYGRKSAERIGYRLASSGIIVVTGLARGVDSAVSHGALRGGGRVIGVVGTGLDIVYPRENKTLFEDIARTGAIVSEYPPGTPPNPWHFPARNRIISGMSLGVAVIEAPQKSGALITASRALEQGRDVFVLPGNVDAKNSIGSNRLLREGAIPILSGDDIVSEYADLFPGIIKQPDTLDNRDGSGSGKSKKTFDNESEVDYIDFGKTISSLNGDERTVAEAVLRGLSGADDIIEDTGLAAHKVLTALTMLEIKGSISRSGGLYKPKT